MHLTHFRPARSPWLLAGCLCFIWIGLVLLARYQATSTLGHTLNQILNRDLLPRLAGVELYSIDSGHAKHYLAARIAEDLQNLCEPSPLAILVKCSARVMRFKDVVFAQPRPAQTISLSIAENQHLDIGIYYRTRWLLLIFSQGLWLLPLAAFLLWFPKPLAREHRIWAKRLSAGGASHQAVRAALLALRQVRPALQNELLQWLDGAHITEEQAIQLLTRAEFPALYPEQLQWLGLALQFYEGDLTRAFAVACSPPKLQFLPEQRTVMIHGLSLDLPATPFLYYYWYALRRCHGEGGWFINPPAHGVDRHHHMELIALCEKYGGHARAIKDLHDKGLRSKTLDQNRSKIKDELCRLLGETLAADYLFDTERDGKTARYKYRLSLTAQLIELPREDLQLLNSGATQLDRSRPAAVTAAI